jgi:hypothetical protein
MLRQLNISMDNPGLFVLAVIFRPLSYQVPDFLLRAIEKENHLSQCLSLIVTHSDCIKSINALNNVEGWKVIKAEFDRGGRE